MVPKGKMCEVVVIPAGIMSRDGSPVAEVLCNSPASLLVKTKGCEKKRWMCLPHLGYFDSQELVETPARARNGEFVVYPGEIACAHNAECDAPIGGENGAFLVKEPMTGHHLVVCKKHYDLRMGTPRLKVQMIKDPPRDDIPYVDLTTQP